MKRKRLVAMGLVVSVLAACVAQGRLQAAADRADEAPIFEVDPLWPRPLPNHRVLGSVVGVGVDSRDHVFIVHRQANRIQVFRNKHASPDAALHTDDATAYQGTGKQKEMDTLAQMQHVVAGLVGRRLLYRDLTADNGRSAVAS